MIYIAKLYCKIEEKRKERVGKHEETASGHNRTGKKRPGYSRCIPEVGGESVLPGSGSGGDR